MIEEWAVVMTRIGNRLGLEGRFLVEFGFEQIEAKINALADDAKCGASMRAAVRESLSLGEVVNHLRSPLLPDVEK